MRYFFPNLIEHERMIPLLVFYIHIVAAAYVFTKRWQNENTAEAFIAVGFMTVVFFVGWTAATFILKLFVDQEGLGKLFDRDAMSLMLLTILEAGLYSMYFKKKRAKLPLSSK